MEFQERDADKAYADVMRRSWLRRLHQYGLAPPLYAKYRRSSEDGLLHLRRGHPGCRGLLPGEVHRRKCIFLEEFSKGRWGAQTRAADRLDVSRQSLNQTLKKYFPELGKNV